jgi:hypothetical protein
MKIVIRPLLIIVLLLFASGPSLGVAVFGDTAKNSTPTVRVVPSEIANPDLSPSENFTITVEIIGVTDLKGFDIQLSWNSSVLNCTSHDVKVPIETYPEGVLHEPVMELKNEVNATLGTYWVAFATLSGSSFNGDGTVFEMTFTVLDFGQCPLSIINSDLSNSAAESIDHVVEDGYFSNVFYDVAVVSITPSSHSAIIGDVLNVTVVVLNNGTTRSETFDVAVYYNGTLMASHSAMNLPPHVEETLDFQWDTEGLPPADYVISANATTVPDEDRIVNNMLVDGVVTLVLEQVHDVALTMLLPFKTLIFSPVGPWSSGYCFYANVTVENRGNVPENVNITLYVNNIAINNTEIYLNVDASVSVKFAWKALDAVEYEDYLLNATAQTAYSEVDTSDNSLFFSGVRVAHPGDFDADGDVDIFDIVMFAASYGSEAGDLHYNPNLDVDCDGKIQIFDLVMIVPFYGYKKV